MKFRVYHNDQFLNYNIDPVLRGHTVRLVAVVECNGKDDVFRATNHIDSDWTHNPEVIESVERGRSTSVGDIIQDDEGHYYVVESLGFRLLSPAEQGCITFLDQPLKTNRRHYIHD